MKSKLTMMVAAAMACAAIQLTAMPTEEETRKAEPVVKKMLAQERAALESGKKTRSEVAAAAMKLADKAESDAEKLLLMKGACDFYVHAGEFDKAIETLQAMMMKIPDIPYATIVSILEYSLRGISRNSAKDLWAFLDETKSRLRNTDTTHGQKAQSETNIQKFSRLFPGWEVCKEAQGRLGFELAYRGQFNVAVLHPVSQDIPAVVSRTLKLSGKNPCLFLKVSSCDYDGECDWVLSVRVNGKEVLPKRLINKTPNSELWEDITVPLFAWRGQEVKVEVVVTANGWYYEFASFKRLEIAEGSGRENLIPEAKETVDGYTWSYRVQNGEATIISEKEGKMSCAVSPKPVGSIVIPDILGGAKVTSIGQWALAGCQELESVTIPQGVKRIGSVAFRECKKLKSVEIPSSVIGIDWCAFNRCNALAAVNIPSDSDLKSLENGAFAECFALKSIALPDGVTRIARHAFLGCSNLKSLTIPAAASRIGGEAFRYCANLSSVTMLGEKPDTSVPPRRRPHTSDNIFLDCGKLGSIHVPANAKSWAGMKDWHGIPLVFDAAESNVASSSMEDRSSVASILNGMIKVPGRDYWLSETELTQGQWESVMGYNLSSHKGANLPVENVSRDDCDVFLEKLNQTEEVKSSQFEFRLPELEEWKYAVWAGSAGHGSWIKPGIVGDVLDMAWVEANSSNQTHAVATKAPNAFGFYDMLGNVWEWLSRAGGDAPGGCGSLKGCAFTQVADKCTWNQNWHIPTTRRHNCVGLRLAANIKPQRGLLGRSLLRRRSLRSKEGARQQKTDGRDDAVARSTAYMHDVYCVIDISGGSNAEHYPVSYLDSVPEGGWGDEYKTTKIVLRRVAAGTYPMLGNRKVTFTKPFYIGIFELTQKQIKLLSGDNNRKFVFEGDMRPADCLTWDEMRGKNEEFDYPKTKEVAPDSIIGKLRAKTGFVRIDLPTSYQFGCAWNAGTDGSGRDARSTGRHYSNQRDGKGGYTSKHTIVGSYLPNEWGIYDLHGNVWEMCLDHSGRQSAEDESDPVGPAEGAKRQLRGGCWNSVDGFVFADFVPLNKEANDQSGKGGCRIVINVEAERADAPAQKMAVAAKKLQGCNFLLNKDFKKNAKYYLCLFSASWCPPCRREMPRIAKTYAETLKDDPNIELIHFSCDQNDEKALAWAKEHDVKFPVVKPNGGNPLDLHGRGIPHLFIVKADGTLVEEGHPMKLFTDEKLRELKAATP